MATTADQTGLEEATRISAPEYAHRGTALHKHPPTNNEQQILWHKPTKTFAGVHDLPQKCSHKHNPTILLLNAYALAQHTDQAINAPKKYRSSFAFSHTRTDQGTQSSTYILARAYCQPRGSSHRCAATKMLAKTYHYPEMLVTKVNRQGTRSATVIFPRDIVSPNTILMHMYRSLERHGHPKAQHHRYHSKATFHGRQDYQHHNC